MCMLDLPGTGSGWGGLVLCYVCPTLCVFEGWCVDQKAAVFVREQEAMDQENMNGKRIEISDISIGYQGLCSKGTLRSIIIRAFIMLCHSICVVNLHICSASPASC